MNELKTIKIDRDVYSELTKRIQDFNDTPNTILRRVFNIDSYTQPGPDRVGKPVTRVHSKNIQGRIRGDRQRLHLKKIYGKKVEGYPLLYHAGWPLDGGTIQKYSFGLPVRKFREQQEQDGLIVFICGTAEVSFFIPCDWIAGHSKKQPDSPRGQLKFNIPVAGDDFFWMNKKDGILINCFKNRLP